MTDPHHDAARELIRRAHEADAAPAQFDTTAGLDGLFQRVRSTSTTETTPEPGAGVDGPLPNAGLDTQQAERGAVVVRYLANREAGADAVPTRPGPQAVGERTQTGGVPPTFAQEVRRLRKERGLSLTQMSDLVPYSKGHLSKIENGQVPPNAEMGRKLDDALQADGHLIELADAPVRPIPSDQAVLHTYDAMFEHHRTLGQRVSPEVVLMGLRPQIDILSSMARSADDRGISRSLWLLAARYAEYAGWLEQERGDDVSAAELTKRAVEYAVAGGDQELEAYAFVRAAEFALYRGDARATLGFARRAGRSCSTAVQALAAQREAQGYALAGDSDRSAAALDRAVELQRTAAESPDGATNPVEQVDIIRAWTLHDLGRYAEAAAILDTQIPLIAPSALRARTRFGLRRALAHAEAGNVDHACELVGALLDDLRQVQSATMNVDMNAFSRLLSRLRPAAGREIAGEINEILSLTTSQRRNLAEIRSDVPSRVVPMLTLPIDFPANPTGRSIDADATGKTWIHQIPLLPIG